MPYVQNIIANEAGFKSRLKKTGLIAGCKDRPVDVLLPMFCASQDACLDSVITHSLQPTFMDRAVGKNLVAAKAAVAKKHSDDDRSSLLTESRLWPVHDRHGLGDVRRLRPRDAHHDPQDRHPPHRQAQLTSRTDHLPDQLAPFHCTSVQRWGAANCLRVRQLNVDLRADSNDDG